MVDRMEGDYAVCEGEAGETREIPVSMLPDGVHEGAVLVCGEAGWRLDPDEEQRVRDEAIRLKKRLFKRRGT